MGGCGEATECGCIYRDEPWNFLNLTAEFSKIFHRKMWALLIIDSIED